MPITPIRSEEKKTAGDYFFRTIITRGAGGVGAAFTPPGVSPVRVALIPLSPKNSNSHRKPARHCSNCQRGGCRVRRSPAGSVFISYRREGGAETARLLRYELLARGWSAFLDVEDLKAGKFDEMLLAEVASAENFLLILSPGALANCVYDKDWLRKEIQRAIETERNIVPVLKENASRPDREQLPDEIEPLKRFNCIDYSHVYYDGRIERLFSFLKPSEA